MPIAIVALAAAVGLTALLRPWLEHTHFVLLFGATMVAAGLGGRWLGLAVAAAGLAGVELLVFRSEVVGPLTLRYALYAGIAGSLAVLVGALKRAHEASVAEHGQAERLAHELREQAHELELQVTESGSLANELEHVNQQLAEQTDAALRAAVRAERLQHFTTRLLDWPSEAAMAVKIAEEGRQAVEAAAAVVGRLGEDGALEILAASGYDDRSAERAMLRPASPLRDVILTGRSIWFSEPDGLRQAYPEAAEQLASLHGAWAALPLDVKQRRLGAVLFSFDRPGRFHPEDRSFIVLLAHQCAQALDRARIYELERRARVRAEFAERRLAFLADASQRLSASLDYLTTLANLAEYAVPEFADWCLVHLTDESGAPRLITIVHRDGRRLELRRQIEERYVPSILADTGIGRVLRTGQTDHTARVTDEVLRGAARDEEHLEMLRRLGVREQLAVPIRAEDTVRGAITFAITDSTRTFDEADITLAEELGRRVGQAVENARLYQAAQHASEAKSNFLAVMSHELRTPLNAITGYSDLLLLGVPDGIPDRARRQVERIRVAAGTLLHLVEEVLSFSRIEAGKEEIRISPVDVAHIARECLSMVEPLAVEKNLDLVLDLPDEPVKIVSDERKIRQILMNLLSNAVKFTEQGRIGVELVRGVDAIEIRVHDTGIGIPAEHIERIFEPFWQVEPASTRRFGGTGLGLGVARKLARLLEGQLVVDSEVGVGSTFVLTLPQRVRAQVRSA